MNTISLTGRLTHDPELRTTQSGKSVCMFSIAVNRIGIEGTDFINCQVWGTQAENLCKYQKKGNLIGLVGSLRNESFQTDSGETKHRSYVIANNIEYLTSKKEDSESSSGATSIKSEEIILTDDDLPF